MQDPIIIIGAGAAGLMAARELSAAGYPVILLEGAERTGGRIHTITAPGFEQPIELGAEFVHGRLPISLALLREAGLETEPVTGNMVRVNYGKWQQQEDFTIDWDLLMQKLHALKTDMTMAAFLQAHFPGDEYAALRNSVQRFTEGFDVADVNDVSALALREEWSHEEHGQYRVSGGYGPLVQFLAGQCRSRGVLIHTGCVVKKIDWQKGRVQVSCANGQHFTGHQLIITVPAAVLQAGADQTAGMEWAPVPEAYRLAAQKTGYGSVTKLLLQFNTAFWNSYAKNPGFIISEAPIGTWWTQSTPGAGLLTGWAGGPRAARLAALDEPALVQEGLRSLAAVFNKTVEELQALLVTARAVDWLKNPFSLGAYSYDTIHTAGARRLLHTPIENTVFFAGEALYDGPSPGTVEAALTSGRDTARMLMKEKEG